MRHLFVLSIWLLPSALIAQEVGDKIIVITNEAELKTGSTVVGTVPRGNHLSINDIDGDWYWVLWEGTYGWINRSDVIPFDQGIDYFTKATRQDPSSHNYYIRGMIWYEKGEDDIAIGDYNEAIRLNPKFASTYYNRGLAWYGKGDLDKAIKDYSEAIRLDPKHALAYNNRAWLYATASNEKYRDGDKALANATKACDLSGWKNDQYIGTLSATYAENGDFEEAINWLKKAMEIGPDNHVETRKEMMALFEAGKPYRDKPRE